MGSNYYLPTRLIFGTGCLWRIKEVVRNFGIKRILVVSGKEAMRKAGLMAKIKLYLKEYKLVVFDKVSPNPDTAIVDAGSNLARKSKSELIIGLGGGSVLDAAKAMSLVCKNRGNCETLLLGKFKIVKEALPFIAIPTTAGTGSEVTQYAVITVQSRETKIALKNEFLFPKWAIIDPALTMSMSRDLTASTGLDALCHAIESLWSKRASPLSDYFALIALKLILKNLSRACTELGNIKIRQRMSLASLLAGVAIAGTGTTAVHAISYPLTYYFNLPHGLACAIILPAIINYNLKAAGKTLDVMAAAAGFRSRAGFIKRLKRLLSELGIPSRLRDVKVKEENLDLIIEKSFSPNIRNNPRPLTKKALAQILKRLF